MQLTNAKRNVAVYQVTDYPSLPLFSSKTGALPLLLASSTLPPVPYFRSSPVTPKA